MSVVQMPLRGATARGGERAPSRRLWRFAGRAVATVREWRRRGRERALLAQLDERMLRDIGLSRAEAEYMINKPFWRE